ncbi:MAG TPA: glutamate synthase-related protein [Desulfatiglandales bacterium]|nr:glutamate synthase-related protein [Desulfatiglandales bacterium]
MSSRYMIHTQSALSRFKKITRSGVIAWEEGCLNCPVCVKRQCVYGVYDNRSLDARQMIDSLDNECMNCLRCVQGCPKELIHKSLNPEYHDMGDVHWTPDIISTLWDQAETGKIPVSGAGYPGPFSGPGFDSMWTDMSEIVRPTRDGIHGREYISTTVDLGGTPSHLEFGENGDLLGDPPTLITIPLPIILKVPSFGAISKKTLRGWAMAARRLETLIALPQTMVDDALDEFSQVLIPMVSPEAPEVGIMPKGVRLVEIPWENNWHRRVKKVKQAFPSMPISVRVPMDKNMEERVFSLVEEGVSIIHLEGDSNARFQDNHARHLKDGIRAVHLKFVEENARDGVTLLASGGIAMAEHVAKSIICGADAVFVDFPILIALECRMCRRCTQGLPCPAEIGRTSPSWVAARALNLLGAWHNQLLEVMGAMGIRDARRLRGEAGRAMFFQDLDRSTFGFLGEFEEGCEFD